MLERYLAEGNVIGASSVESIDGGLLLMFSSVDGKHFLKSYDNFRTVSESWVVPMDSMTASANLFRLSDGRLMMTIRKISRRPEIAAVIGADFYLAFSDDDGHTFTEGKRVNSEEKCYYLMNDRIRRTHTGRILIPVCHIPDEYTDEKYFEKCGYAGCFYSDDEGETWSVSDWVRGESVDQLAEPMIAQGSDGVIHMYMRTGYGYLYYSKSCDNAETWEDEKPSMLRSPCAPFCINYDKYSNKFFAVWDNSFPAPQHQNPRSPICLAVSDDCVNWKLVCELDNNPMQSYGYPMMHFDENEILITYYENNSRDFNAAAHKLKMKLFSREELKYE